MERQIEKSEDIMAIMSVHIDKDWAALDFLNFFESINKLYEFHKVLSNYKMSYEALGKEYNWPKNIEGMPMFKQMKFGLLSEANVIFEDRNYRPSFPIMHFTAGYRYMGILEVKKIRYGSPGNIDLLGIGKIFETVKELFVHYLPNKEKKLDNIMKSQEIEIKEQKILQEKIETLKKLGLTTTEIMSMVGLEAIQIQSMKELSEREIITEVEIKKLK